MTKRLFWKLARVEELLNGRDGNVRAAIVRVSNSKGTSHLFRRSLKHLFPIELSYDQQMLDQADRSVKDKNNNEPETLRHSTRISDMCRCSANNN